MIKWILKEEDTIADDHSGCKKVNFLAS